jgi:hypothetical protein
MFDYVAAVSPSPKHPVSLGHNLQLQMCGDRGCDPVQQIVDTTFVSLIKHARVSLYHRASWKGASEFDTRRFSSVRMKCMTHFMTSTDLKPCSLALRTNAVKLNNGTIVPSFRVASHLVGSSETALQPVLLNARICSRCRPRSTRFSSTVGHCPPLETSLLIVNGPFFSSLPAMSVYSRAHGNLLKHFSDL